MKVLRSQSAASCLSDLSLSAASFSLQEHRTRGSDSGQRSWLSRSMSTNLLEWGITDGGRPFAGMSEEQTSTWHHILHRWLTTWEPSARW